MHPRLWRGHCPIVNLFSPIKPNFYVVPGIQNTQAAKNCGIYWDSVCDFRAILVRYMPVSAFSSLTVLRAIDGVAPPLELKAAMAAYIRSLLAMTNQFPALHRLVRFSNRFPLAAYAAVLVALIALPGWAATLLPLATWSSNGDGWLTPGEDGYAYLGGANTNSERGLAYGNNHLYL